jgi:uncharacterized Zn finger protein
MTNSYSESDKEWWAQQWVDLLNSYRFKKRLERGRRYAMEGNVVSIDFSEQKIIAKVQGTDPEPYELSLWLDQFTEEDWQYVVKSLSERAIFSAKLLAGEMPANIEDVFATNGLRLFPFKLSEIHSRCSCPDKANPCKHIAAVYYLLGDRFSEDPFLLFQLRGRSQAELIANLRELREIESADNANNTDNFTEKSQVKFAHPPLDLEDFWQYDQPLDSGLVVIAPPPSTETILDVLGPVGSSVVTEYLQTVYPLIGQQAMLAGLNRDN